MSSSQRHILLDRPLPLGDRFIVERINPPTTTGGRVIGRVHSSKQTKAACDNSHHKRTATTRIVFTTQRRSWRRIAIAYFYLVHDAQLDCLAGHNPYVTSQYARAYRDNP